MADTLALGANGRKPVGVQVPSPAPARFVAKVVEVVGELPRTQVVPKVASDSFSQSK